MRYNRSIALAGASLLAVVCSASAAFAQEDPPASQQRAEAEEPVIVVTARRKDEVLLDVPATVTAVSGQQMQDFQITKFEDISTLVAGLTLESDSSGYSATAQTRGVLFQVTAQGSPTVEQYMNEVPIEPNLMFASNFDIGQIEVLRGPQGTLRGRSAPSGAITSTTRRPDLQEWGASASANVTSLDGVNAQLAAGVPIIKDVLGIRVAGVWDQNDAGGVESVNNPKDPRTRMWAGRVTLRFEPSDRFSAVLMYQRLERNIHDYGGELFGNGAVGLTDFPGTFTRPATSAPCSSLSQCGSPAVYAPPGFNGPVLAAGDHLTILDFENFTRQRANLYTGQADWSIGGQKLSFVGSSQHFQVQTYTDQDPTNTIVDTPRFTSRASDSVENRLSGELRLSSETSLIDGLLDYTVGGFYLKLSGLSQSEQRNTLLAQGAFGSPLGAGTLPGGGTAPGVLSPFTYDRRYAMGFVLQTPRKDVEKSVFASIALHLFGGSTEVTAGGRQIWRSTTKQVDVVGIPGIAAVFNPNGLGPCPATLPGPLPYLTGLGTVSPGTAVVGSTYPGTCDVAINLGVGAPAQVVTPIPRGTRSWDPFVYNFSLSHKITPDLNVYASYGTAWRAGPGPITAAPTCAASLTAPLPAGQAANQCDRFLFLEPEYSRAVEVGVKASLFDHRLNLAVALYRQKYSGLFILGSATPYLSGTCTAANLTNPNICSVASGGFTYNAPATAKGIDFDASLRLSEDFNMGVLFSWSKGRFDNAEIPCRDSNFDGIPDSGTLPATPTAWLAAGGPYGPALCKVNTASTTAPPWNATLRGEYSHELFKDGRGFIRTLVNYYPRNTNRQVSNINFVPNKYALVNLWAGIRGDRGDWEVSISAKNIFNNQTILTQGLDAGTLITPQRNLPFANNVPSGCSPVGGACVAGSSLNSGYRSVSFSPRREFALNFRMAFGSH